jgi:hypothetical protein
LHNLAILPEKCATLWGENMHKQCVEHSETWIQAVSWVQINCGTKKDTASQKKPYFSMQC